MEISKAVLGVMVAVGVGGVAAPARADVFNPFFPVSELHATGGGNTAGSFAASAMMGAKGHSNQALIPNWEASITSQCATQTVTSPWPGTCNPSGMARALANLTGKNWIQSLWPATDQASALNTMVSALKDHGSPAIVPIYGQADHWVAVTQITATANGTGWTIGNVKFFDGGPPGGVDGGSNSYTGTLLSYSGATWSRFYFEVLENIGACDPCTSDPWYDHFVLMWEPPPGQEHTNLVAQFPRAPGVSQNTVTEPVAQSLVWKALAAGGVTADPEVWNPISGTVPGAAFEVNAVDPSGARWDYFLVPLLSADNTVKAYVHLAADDAAFEGIQVLPAAEKFAPVGKVQAEALARASLQKGEHLSAGILTWSPRANTPFAKSPVTPYYEFGVMSGNKEISVVRVSLNKGVVSRAQ